MANWHRAPDLCPTALHCLGPFDSRPLVVHLPLPLTYPSSSPTPLIVCPSCPRDFEKYPLLVCVWAFTKAQAFHRHHRQHHHDPEHETEISKTPEESTGSAADTGQQTEHAGVPATPCGGGGAMPSSSSETTAVVAAAIGSGSSATRIRQQVMF